MKVKMLKKFLEEFDDNLEVYFLQEPEQKAFKITKIGIPEDESALLLGSGACPNCEGE